MKERLVTKVVTEVSANQWTGFYMIGTFVFKEFMIFILPSQFLFVILMQNDQNGVLVTIIQ